MHFFENGISVGGHDVCDGRAGWGSVDNGRCLWREINPRQFHFQGGSLHLDQSDS